MAYRGQTLSIPFNVGGFNYSQNVDTMPPTDFVFGSRNLNLDRGGREKRGGTSKVNGTAVSGGPRIMGGFDFRLSSSSFQVFLTSDGKLWKDTSNTIKTGMSTANFPSFAVFGSELIVCDGDTTPQTWDGSAAGTSNLTSPAADWSGSNQPFQVLVHGRGASRRAFYLYGSAVYYSSVNNAKEVTGGTSGKLTVDTGDAFGLVGGAVFGNRLFVFSRRQAYVLVDDDPDTTTWGFQRVQWAAGAAHWRLIVNTPTDLVCVTEDLDIYSVAAAQEYGDYKQASISRPAFVDAYLKEKVNPEYIANFHATYDPDKRAIRFFMTGTGDTTNRQQPMYFIDRPPQEAWSTHDGVSAASGYRASCSFVVFDSSVDRFVVWTGDYAGFLWKLEQSTRSDDSAAYYGGFKTPSMVFGNARVNKHFKRAIIVARAQGNYNLQVGIYVDGAFKETKTVSLAGGGTVLGSFVLGSDQLASTEFIEGEFELNYTGKRLQFEIYNSGVDQTFFVSHLLVDHKTLGAR